jgi:methyl-accepting chemotaxis protein
MEPVVSGAWERLGVAGILVVAGYFLVRYLMAQLDKKDGRLTDVTDRFITATREQTGVIAQVNEEMRRVREAHEKMAEAVNDLTATIRAAKG